MTKIVLPEELLKQGFKHVPATQDNGEHYKKGDKAYFYCNCELLAEVNLKNNSNGVVNVSCDKKENCGKIGKRFK